MSPSGNQKRKIRGKTKTSGWPEKIHTKNWKPNFDCTTVNHARKLPRKPVDLLLVVFY